MTSEKIIHWSYMVSKSTAEQVLNFSHHSRHVFDYFRVYILRKLNSDLSLEYRPIKWLRKMMIRIYSFLIQLLTTLCYKNILWNSRRWNEDESRSSIYNHHQGSTNHQDPSDHLVRASPLIAYVLILLFIIVLVQPEAFYKIVERKMMVCQNEGWVDKKTGL